MRTGTDPRTTAVVWIASEHPLKMAGSEKIRQALEREDGRVKLLILATGGVNVSQVISTGLATWKPYRGSEAR